MLEKTQATVDPYARARPSTPLRRVYEELLLAMSLLTRLPVPGFDIETRATLSSAFWAYPVAGALVGLAGGVCFALASLAGLGAYAGAGLALAAMLIVSGAFHEDGLADFLDGIGGGRTRVDKLEIMRDSRVGTYGAAGLVVLLFTTAALIAQLNFTAGFVGPWGLIGPLVVAGAMSRAAVGLPLALLQPARAAGLSAETPAPPPLPFAIAWGLALFAGAILTGPGAAIAAALAAVAVVLIVSLLAHRHLGGRTGDVLGAAAALAQVAALAALIAASQPAVAL